MRFLLDTCVVSELVRAEPEPKVLRWVGGQKEEDQFLSVLTLGELEAGLETMQDSSRRARLLAWVREELPRRFERRLLPVTLDVAREWGRIQGRARRRGRPLPAVDSLMAATALTHNMVLVTRDVTGVSGSGVEVLDPWEAR